MMEAKRSVEMLTKTLERKKVLLTELKKYTDNQQVILNNEKFDMKAFKNIMRNKKVRIDALHKLDAGIEKNFTNIGALLSETPEEHKEAIAAIKGLIQELDDLGKAIQSGEEENKHLFEGKKKGVRHKVKSFRQHKTAMKGYQNNYKSMAKADSPHFFDSKK